MITGDNSMPAVSVTEVDPDILEGDVLIDVHFAGINFKDSLATRPNNKVARIMPLIGGVDLAGTVLSDSTGTFEPGTAVLGTGHGIGTSWHGGFAERARLPAGWVSPLPAGLDQRAAMILGTAGWTAMASLLELERTGLVPSDGPLLVTGAAGGVGSTAVALAAAAGFDVVASSGRAHEADFLHRLGTQRVIGRDEIGDDSPRVLGEERWAGAIDCVGGETLTQIIRSLHYGGAVAASGMTGGDRFTSSIFPFIVRAVQLLGIDSVEVAPPKRHHVWQQLAQRFPPQLLETILEREISLDDVPEVLELIGSGQVRGRVIVEIT